VNNIYINGTQNISQQDITNEVRADLDGKYAKIINKNNLFLVRPNKIQSQLTSDFKKIEEVSVTRKFPSTLVVNITERKPTLIFSSDNHYYIVDDSGQAFEEINQDSSDFQNDAWPIFQDDSNAKINLNDTAIDQDLLNFFMSARSKLNDELDIDLDRTSETPNRMSYDIRIKTTDGWMIYFDGNLNLDKQIETLKTVLATKIGKDDRPNLEYIDLRSDNKVFYKFKDGTQQNGSGDQAQTQPDNQNNTAPDNKDTKKDDKKKG
jgi:cell division septal protein FtsQ